MIKAQPSRTLTHLLLQVQPNVGFISTLSEVARRVAPILEESDHKQSWNWTANNSVCVFRTPTWFLAFTFNSVLVQTVGLTAWNARLDKTAAAIESAMPLLQPDGKVPRIAFKVRAMLILGLKHSEMCDAMFGSYLAQKDEIENVVPQLDDLSLRLFGNEGDRRLEIALIPQTSEQVRSDTASWPNIDNFVDPATRVTPVAELLRELDSPTLTVDCEISHKNYSHSVSGFIRSSVNDADALITRAVRRVQGLPLKA